ncbi:glycosyltransferase family A protein [Halorubrum sp. DM2]|uniref:glycosyltransferase family 2 protein n=1 Tax=Halorubrum sp. DM2 TaxID=2527867 RepID=UPI0024B766B2|nr:glycosyltransferase family A protein [Halorubrum sp. DM2]
MEKENQSRNQENIQVSIIIPVYNQPDLLADALDSIYRQTIDNYEVIVIDDNSDVDYGPIIDSYDSRVTLVVHDENKGAAEARNTGIDAAKSDFLAFLDADDLWRPTKLAKQLSVFQRGSEKLGLVYTGYVQQNIDETNKRVLPEASGEIYISQLERDQLHPTSTVMLKRECLEQVGGFDSSLPSRQDYDLWIRITERFEVDYVDEILVEKREQEDSISKNFESRIKGDLGVYRKVLKRTNNLGFLTRNRILSHHHYVIGRDYGLKGNRTKSLNHLLRAILRYPIHPLPWALFTINIIGLDREGRLFSFIRDIYMKL